MKKVAGVYRESDRGGERERDRASERDGAGESKRRETTSASIRREAGV